MNTKRHVTLAIAGLAMASAAAFAQTAVKPLNLKLSDHDLPSATSSSAAGSNAPSDAPATASSSATVTGSVPALGPLPARSLPHDDAAVPPPAPAGTRHPKPGVYYGDTSGRMGNVDDIADRAPACDDSTYNQPQVHGSVTTGIWSGSHVGTGTYEGGTVNLSKAFGDCEHPTGGISISIGGINNHFNGH